MALPLTYCLLSSILAIEFRTLAYFTTITTAQNSTTFLIYKVDLEVKFTLIQSNPFTNFYYLYIISFQSFNPLRLYLIETS